MIIYIILMIVLATVGMRPVPFESPFSRNKTLSICGFSVLLVVLSHIVCLGLIPMGYVPGNLLDGSYLLFRSFTGQLIVVPFLFCSGFGVMEQIKGNGGGYVKCFPRKRILPLWCNYMIAVMIYTIFNILIGVKFNALIFVESFFAWNRFSSFQNIGHPTWYVFCIIMCYVFSVISYYISRRGQLWVLLGFIVMYIIGLMHIKPSYFYDTILCYWIGAACSTYRSQIEKLLQKHSIGILAVSSILFVALFKVRIGFSLQPTVHGILMMVAYMAFASRMSFGNKWFCWLGKKVFPIYMYHMLFFFIFAYFYTGPVTNSIAHIALIVIVGCTLITAFYYDNISVSSDVLSCYLKRWRICERE